MTTRHPLFDEWQARLAKLNRLIASGVGRRWQYEIRAKILNYFISRYGQQTSLPHPFAQSQLSGGSQKAFFATKKLHHSGEQTKSREMIRPLLEDIQQTVHPHSQESTKGSTTNDS